MTYPQQPYGQQPYGYGYGPQPPPPPPKKNTALIVSLVAVVVVVLAGLGVTGFVAPGFFLSEDDDPPVSSPTTTSTRSSAPEPGGDAEDALTAVATGLDSRDKDALEKIACADAEPIVSEAIGDAENITAAELTDADGATGIVEITVGRESADFEVTVVEDGGDWCWQDIEVVGGGPSSTANAPDDGTPTAGGQPVPAEALAAMQMFLDAVNTGDAAAAKGTLCGDAIATAADVDELVGYDPDLAIDPAMDGIASGDKSMQLYLRGTAKGQELEGYSTNLWVTSYDGPWCVHAFRAVVI